MHICNTSNPFLAILKRKKQQVLRAHIKDRKKTEILLLRIKSNKCFSGRIRMLFVLNFILKK